MRTLNSRDLHWIINHMREKDISVYRIAKQQHVTPQWCRELYKRFDGIPIYKIKLDRPGRKSKPISDIEIQKVIEAKTRYGFGATNTEAILKSNGVNVPHNRIHAIFKEFGLAKDEPKKQKRRKWIRYERYHSNSLWHTDYHELNHQHIVPFLDDASRFIPGYGIFNNETAENAAYVFENAVNDYGIPKQVVSDHGTQFVSLKREGCEDPKENEFQQKLRQYRVQHILARVKHPQTNGKMERWFGTLDQLTRWFKGDIKKAVHFYNFERPHMSLTTYEGHLRTPYEAFMDKRRKN
jgi:putative transposase